MTENEPAPFDLYSNSEVPYRPFKHDPNSPLRLVDDRDSQPKPKEDLEQRLQIVEERIQELEEILADLSTDQKGNFRREGIPISSQNEADQIMDELANLYKEHEKLTYEQFPQRPQNLG